MKVRRRVLAGLLVLASLGASNALFAQEAPLPITRFQEPLAVVAIGPADGARDVPVGTSIRIEFSLPLDCLTVIGANLWVAPVGAPDQHVAGELRCETQSATFQPALLLALGTEYAVTVTTMIRAARGERLDADFVFTFTTAENALTILPPGASAGERQLGAYM